MKILKMLMCMGIVCMFFGENAYAQYSDPVEGYIVDISNHVYTFAEMECDLAELTQRYPGFISCIPIGTSLDSRRIWEVIIGNPQAPKAIFIEAAVHGREWMNSWMLMKQIEEILSSWETSIVEGMTLGSIFDQCAIYIMPMVNPDGVTISESGMNAIMNEALRANLYQMKGASDPAKWKANAAGVDINRNFSIGWGNKVEVLAPASQCYNGIAPFSEPETLAIASVFAQRKFDIAISYHSMEGAIYWDIGQEGEILDKTAALAIEVQQITGYKFGEKSRIHGLDYNWMIFDQNTPAVLIETGTVACPLPYSQWQEIWDRNKDMMKLLAIGYAAK